MAKLQPGTRQKLLFAAAALTMLLAPAPPVGAQTLAGLHIGDNLQAAIALYGQPRPYPSPFPGELWLLPNGDRLNVVSRNDKIVGLLLRGQASPTGFLGITFDVTTQARIVERFGSHGVSFSKSPSVWRELDGTTILENAYEITGSRVIVDFRSRLDERNGKHDAKLEAVSLWDVDESQLRWGSLEPRSADYRTITVAALTGKETPAAADKNGPARNEISLQNDGATLQLRVLVNGSLEVPFLLDTGASDIVIPEDIYSVLQRQGTIGPDDVREPILASLADGSVRIMKCFRLHRLGSYVTPCPVYG